MPESDADLSNRSKSRVCAREWPRTRWDWDLEIFEILASTISQSTFRWCKLISGWSFSSSKSRWKIAKSLNNVGRQLFEGGRQIGRGKDSGKSRRRAERSFDGNQGMGLHIMIINNSGKHAFIFVVFFDCFAEMCMKSFVPIFQFRYFFGWKPSNNWIFSNRLKTWGWLGSRDASKAKRAWSDFTDDCFVSVSFNRINLTLIRLPSWAYWVTSKRCKMPSRKGCFLIVFIVNMWLTWRKPSVSTFCVL